jgi:hypothetical protein
MQELHGERYALRRGSGKRWQGHVHGAVILAGLPGPNQWEWAHFKRNGLKWADWDDLSNVCQFVEFTP